ncbi:MAG: hypothetical protein CVU52_03695 [Deltaproteobacteria bacterium HGW-Deltaproteobacteria-10]|nr:MAG: hypothetical protein CVU52_03695 [Deltaproteobacteria bacterium HGW-Deltaproteobacteria-10]
MGNPTNCQNRYWKELYQLRVHLNYLELYMEQSEFIDKAINVFLAVTSSGSICGWAIWNKLNFMWAGIIAASQLVSAVKQFLPYRTRLKAISGVLKEFEELLTMYEMKWFDVAEGNLTEAEINKLQYEMRSKKVKILYKHLGSNTLPPKDKLFSRAKEIANTYITNFYGG